MGREYRTGWREGEREKGRGERTGRFCRTHMVISWSSPGLHTQKMLDETLVERENEWPSRKGSTENLAFRALMLGLEGSLGRRRGRRAQDGRGSFQKERGVVKAV